MKTSVAILSSILTVSVASACNIPVFRYALERWRPDQCEVIVFHDGGLTTSQEQALQRLNADSDDPAANVELIQCDVSDADSPHVGLYQSLGSTDAALPYVVVRTKLGPGQLVNGWHGPLDAVTQLGVLDSPARQELGRRLLSGHSIVWLVIGSDDDEKNKSLRSRLSKTLKSLERNVELPEGIGLPGSELHSEVPLLVQFSMLEIARDDANEEFLVKLLSGFQTDAFDEGEPLVIPVFGRGRALEVIPAADLTDRLAADLTAFLSGACSCQVKEQNPGFDLLISVNWNTELFGEGAEPPPARTTRDRAKPVLLTIPPGN